MLPSEVGKFIEGVWLPKDEQHLVDWMVHGKKAARVDGRITYQWGKQEAAMAFADELGFTDGVMIDVGAHCALWSMWWAQKMPRIIAYEPIGIYRVLYEANMESVGCSNYYLVPFGLAEAPQDVHFRVDLKNTGGTRAYANGEKRDVDEMRLHCTQLDLDLTQRLRDGERVSVLKIDCEGFEERVLRGGLKTIERFRPMVIVEQKFEEKWFGYERHGAVTLLKSLGYRVLREIGGDFIMAPA